MDKFKKRVKWLSVYAIFNTLVLVIVLLLMLSKNKGDINDKLFFKADTLAVSSLKAEILASREFTFLMLKVM